MKYVCITDLSPDFMALLDNYDRNCGVPERVTKEELHEQGLFIAAALKTAPVKHVTSPMPSHTHYLTGTSMPTCSARAWLRRYVSTVSMHVCCHHATVRTLWRLASSWRRCGLHCTVAKHRATPRHLSTCLWARYATARSSAFTTGWRSTSRRRKVRRSHHHVIGA